MEDSVDSGRWKKTELPVIREAAALTQNSLESRQRRLSAEERMAMLFGL